MSQNEQAGDRIEGTITGDVSGQVAIGKHIQQQSTVGGALTQQERAELDRMLTELRARVAAQAPPEQKEAALERVGEVEAELKSDKPDPVTLAYVRQWFVKKLPGLAGAVVSVVVHPLVGKLVGAVGEGLADRISGGLKNESTGPAR